MECLAAPLHVGATKVAGKGLRQMDANLVFALLECLLLEAVGGLGYWGNKATVDHNLLGRLDGVAGLELVSDLLHEPIILDVV